MVFDISLKHDAKCNVIRLKGDLAHDTVGSVQASMQALTIGNMEPLVFDFSDLDFIDSKGAGFLLQLKQKAKGRKIVLVGLSSPIFNVLERLQVTEQYKVFRTLDEAMMKL
ncbi:MAG TPA: STAS domain-containing protein [bacterium]|nr:STAS domain-containing protein [bacterium]